MFLDAFFFRKNILDVRIYFENLQSVGIEQVEEYSASSFGGMSILFIIQYIAMAHNVFLTTRETTWLVLDCILNNVLHHDLQDILNIVLNFFLFSGNVGVN